MAGKRRYDRQGTCTNCGWRKAATPDPALLFPPGWSSVYTTNVPEPAQPAASFTLERLGRTLSIRAVFPLRQWAQVFSRDGQTRIQRSRNPAQPFETVLELQTGRLFAGFCDENAVFHDSGDTLVSTAEGWAKAIWIDNDEFEKKGGLHPGQVEQFICRGCYFVNREFHDGAEDERDGRTANGSAL